MIGQWGKAHFACQDANTAPAAAFKTQKEPAEVLSWRLTNLGGGTATLRLFSATSRPFWAQATNRKAMKNCWREKKHIMWHISCDHKHLMLKNKHGSPAFTCLLREPLRSESAKSHIYGDKHSLDVYQHNQRGQKKCNTNALISVFTHFPEDQVGQTRPLQKQGSISRCHPPTASRINLHTTTTNSY